MPRGGAISQTERVRLAEDAVLKTVAPAMVSKVRVLGAPPFHPPAWCNSSTLGSQPGNPGALPGAGATFIRPIAQKESDRLTSGRPRSVTSSGDHFSFLRSSKAEPSPDKRECTARKRIPANAERKLHGGRAANRGAIPRGGTIGCVAEIDQRLAEDEESPARYRTQPPLSKASLV